MAHLDRLRLPALLLLAAIAIAIGWVGFIASDDALYFAGAEPWLTHAFPGDTHWATRFPLTIAFAVIIAALGKGFAAFAVVSLLFYAVLVGTTGLAAKHIAGARAGWIAAAIVATLPVVVSHATTVSVDLLESSALLIGAMLLAEADDTRRGLWRAVLAGASFGAAILCRETSLLPLAGLAIPFLMGRPVSRRVLLIAGAATAAVLLGEAIFQWAMTGEPWRRYTIAFHHDEHIDRAANLEGNFLVHPAIDPLLVLLVNDDFGLLFWLAGAAALRLSLAIPTAAGRRRLAVLTIMAAASFVLVSVLYTKLVLNPRYFMLPALAATILVAGWLAHLAARMRALILSAVLASNLLLLSVANAHPRWEMEVLTTVALEHPREAVSADPATLSRATLPIRFDALRNVSRQPVPGGLFVAPAETPAPGRLIARYPSPPTRLGALLRALHLDALVPGPIARRMFAPSPAMKVVRLPA